VCYRWGFKLVRSHTHHLNSSTLEGAIDRWGLKEYIYGIGRLHTRFKFLYVDNDLYIVASRLLTIVIIILGVYAQDWRL
jgi:hypothetical protein